MAKFRISVVDAFSIDPGILDSFDSLIWKLFPLLFAMHRRKKVDYGRANTGCYGEP